MTKEELKQEAEEWIAEYTGIDVETQRAIRLRYHDNLRNAYIASAEPREKRIAELEKRCANYEMNISKMEKGTCDICKETEKDKKIEELEAQIKKMKCCGNCVWSDCESKHPPCKCCDFNNKWELRR